jgi:nicotinamide-nucleotide amidase
MLKHTILGVDAALLDERGPVHPEVAEQMADGVRAAVRIGTRPADVGIATTGIAGPDSPDGQPVGTVHIGIATPAARYSRAFRFAGGRAEIRQQAVDAAIAEALAAVREYPHADAR